MTVDQLKTHLSSAFDDGPDRELTFVPMFGGRCAYVNGRVFAWLFKIGLALKIDSETAKIWGEDGAKPLQFDPDGPIFKAHIVIPPAVIKDEDKLADWVAQSVEFVMSQPPPKPRSRRKKMPSF
ncbi:hypothetical protein IAD21_03194 [Abditibacteriota bacterium]|nr:hypothetical protein IAD21_03194 [Abditibacteriota bacterium]